MGIQQMMLRSYKNPVQVQTATYSAIALSPADASINFTLDNTDNATTSTNGAAPVTQYNWLASGAAAAYEVRATIVSGTVTSGTTGSWLALSTSRSWTKVRTDNLDGTDEVVLTIEIREAVSGIVRGTGTVTLRATVNL